MPRPLLLRLPEYAKLVLNNGVGYEKIGEAKDIFIERHPVTKVNF